MSTKGPPPRPLFVFLSSPSFTISFCVYRVVFFSLFCEGCFSGRTLFFSERSTPCGFTAPVSKQSIRGPACSPLVQSSPGYFLSIPFCPPPVDPSGNGSTCDSTLINGLVGFCSAFSSLPVTAFVSRVSPGGFHFRVCYSTLLWSFELASPGLLSLLASCGVCHINFYLSGAPFPPNFPVNTTMLGVCPIWRFCF